MTEQTNENLDEFFKRMVESKGELSKEQVLDNVEKALKEREEIINSETATEDEKKKAIEEKTRIESILISAVKLAKVKDAKKAANKLKVKAKLKVKKIRQTQKASRKANRKK